MLRIVLGVLLVAASAPADILSLKDGRFLEDVDIDRADGGYVVKYEHGDVFVPDGMVASYFRERDEAWEPRTAEEKEQFEKGKVPYRGRFVSKAYRDRMRARKKEARRTRIEQQKARRLWRNHVTVKSRRFVYKHTLPDDVFAELQDLFEAYYAYFTKFWRIRPSSKFGKPTIHIYHNREYFEQVSGAPGGVVGYFHPLHNELHFYYDRQRHRFTLDVMFHEGNHMLTQMIATKVMYPWWINEGMAEYFGASRWDPIKKTMSVGHLQSARLAVLKHEIDNDRWLDLEKLLRADRMGATEYAWTWSFCHFLLSTDKYEKPFRKYYIALGKSSSVKKTAIQLAFKIIKPDEAIEALKKRLKIKSLTALQQEWYDYLKDNLTQRREDLDFGMAGWIMKLYGENKKARTLFKKAIKNGSRQAYVHFGYAELRYPGKPDLALKHAELATRYDPLHARAWALRGRCLLAKDDKKGMKLVQLGNEMAPDDDHIWRWLAMEQEKDSE